MSNDKRIRYECPVCGAGGASPASSSIPLCHVCNYAVTMESVELKAIRLRESAALAQHSDRIEQLERDKLQQECDQLVRESVLVRNDAIEEAAQEIEAHSEYTEEGDILVMCAENIRALKGSAE